MNPTPSQSSDVKFEIGHVLFIDIVGYSKLLINEQSDQIQTLKQIVRGTDQFRIAEAEDKLLRLPTGDGGALVFRTNPEAPVLCAIEIANALKAHPDLRVRMGIHSGPVNEVTDLNEKANIAGAGVNIAQRVTDCGDAGHILLSKHVAEDLEHYPRWKAYLHDLGSCEVKHGVRLGVVNLYNDEIGNPQVPKKFHGIARHGGARWIAIAAALIVIAAIVAASVIVSRKSTTPASSVSDKSIAVLPFENLSDDKANTYFADGIQDEILTKLASESEQVGEVLEAALRERPNDLNILTQLSWIYLALGRNAEALSAARRAANILPVEKDALLGSGVLTNLAEVEANAGEIEEAIKILHRLLSIPDGLEVSIARLKIDPVWDPIRNDPGFQQLLTVNEYVGP